MPTLPNEAVDNHQLYKKQATEQLIELRNPRFVLHQPLAMSGKALLKITHATGDYPYAEKMGLEEYEHQKHLLQTELLKVQNWVKEHQKKIVILFEGRDAAGKGGGD